MKDLGLRAWMGALGVAAGTLTGAALAQEYPTRPIRIIIPFAPGGATDAVLRMIAPNMSQILGQSVVVENRPGGAATIGMDATAKAPPDGYTVGVANTSFSTNPLLFTKKMPYDTDKDLAPVSLVAIVPFVMSLHPSVPARNIKEIIAVAKSKPGAINYSSSGNGSASQLATELFKYMTKTDMVHVPFTGGGPALTSVLSGESGLMFSSIPPAMGHYQSGRLRPIGITSAARDPSLPDVATIGETVPGYESIEWQGLVVPTGTPPAVIAKLQQAVAKTMSDPSMKKRFAAVGAWPKGSTTEELAAHIQNERKKWAPVIKAANIRFN
ncbi:MAG: tripartite tricarboxylate transporter substrate binding protein [Burkholderiales bacterium]|nr:tripartite tricarboxylate transporter substrate binding protein [Burkholderiales bacterium]